MNIEQAKQDGAVVHAFWSEMLLKGVPPANATTIAASYAQTLLLARLSQHTEGDEWKRPD